MKIFIITVTYNNKIELQQTYNSIISKLNHKDVHWFVVDGNSTDGTHEFLKGIPTNEFNFNISFLIEDDDGLYDAMNKGIDSIPETCFVWFLNAGDLVSNSFFNEWQNLRNSDYQLIIGASKRFNNNQSKTYIKYPRSFSHINKGMICEHQAIIFNSKLLIENNIRYDLRYSLSADYDFIIHCLQLVDINKTYVTKEILCEFKFGGVSKSRRLEGILEGSLIRLRRLKMGIYSILFFALLHVLWDKFKNLTGKIR